MHIRILLGQIKFDPVVNCLKIASRLYRRNFSTFGVSYIVKDFERDELNHLLR